MKELITKPEKYTAEFVAGELKDMIAELKANEEILIMSELFDKRDYSPQRFSEWDKKFKNDAQISEAIKKVRSILEARINLNALKNKINPAVAIFNLKNNYGWKDKQEINANVHVDSKLEDFL